MKEALSKDMQKITKLQTEKKTKILQKIIKQKKEVKTILKKIKITKRKVSLYHTKLLYEWITDKKVINNSFTDKQVSYNYHNKWVKKNLKNQNMVYWIFYVNSIPFGTVRFEKKYKKATLSYTISKYFRGKRLSYPMLDNALNSFIKKNNDYKIFAYVRLNNRQSLKILKNLNFIIKNKKANKIEMIYQK